MEIILFILLVGVWAAFVLPSFVNSRRETPVTQTPPQSGRAPVQRTTAQTGGSSAREQVLARRRNALVAIVFLAIATLAAAIVTGSVALLFVSLVVDVGLAGYIAMLLQIKQRQQAVTRHGRWEEAAQVRVVSS